MEERMFELLQPWAGSSTWYTSHPRDHERFNKVMHDIVSEFGDSFDVELFKSALRQHAESRPELLGGPECWDDTIAKFASRAESIIEYEKAR